MEDIRPILTLEDLREALDLSHIQTEYLPKRFEKIAKALLTEFAIKKWEKLFYITDIEFYYYTDDYKDFITYPRKCHAGEWFFHPSGVDIAFESHIEFDKNNKYKPILNSEVKFGGILIRSIKPAEGTKIEGDTDRLIDHPLNISDFLFDHFDALCSDNRYPVLVKCPHHKEKLQQVTRRDIKKIQDPLEYIKKDVSEIERIKAEKETERVKKFESIWNSYSHNGEEYEEKNNLYKEFTKYLVKKDLRYSIE